MTKVSILELHRVLPENQINRTNGYFAADTLISQEYLRNVLLYLKSKKYSFTTISGIIEQPRKGRCIALTFDDGYADNFEYALPVLKEFGVTAKNILLINGTKKMLFW